LVSLNKVSNKTERPIRTFN